MKKLMIAAAIVCAAAMAHAASVVWYTGTGAICNGWEKSKEGTWTQKGQAGDIYIFNALASGVSQTALIQAIALGGDMTSISSMDSYTTGTGQMKSSAKRPLAADYTTFAPVRHSDDGNDYSDYFYAMMITEQTTGDKYLFVSDTYSAMIQTAKDTELSQALTNPSALYQGEITGTSEFLKGDGGWYKVAAVPEPTSGLLLLLGVAGLALRRRRD